MKIYLALLGIVPRSIGLIMIDSRYRLRMIIKRLYKRVDYFLGG